MSARLKITALVLVASLAAGPAAAIDPFFPTFGNNGIDVRHYALDLDVTPEIGRLEARAGLLIVAQRRLTSFTLDLHALAVSRATIRGVPAGFSQANDKLTITPPRPIPRGAAFRLVIDYSGTPTTIPDPTAPADYQLGWFRYGNASYVVSEPVGASTFYPANDEPTDKATFTTAVTVPATHIGVANGVLRSVRAIGIKKRFVWDMRQPMTTWLATVHVNTFSHSRSRASDGTPIHVYATAATPPADVAGYALAGDILPYFERLIGPYPFASYGSVVVDDPELGYALETQTVSTFPLRVHGREDFVAHELAHQWFGNSAAVKRWGDLWIAEGTATYLEILWPNRNDPGAFDTAMREMYDYAVAEHIGPAVVDAPEDLFSDRTYIRGALALYALRLKVGERTFFRILRTFHVFYRGRNATSRDFINTAVFVSHDRSVRGLLRAWLYEEPVPPLPSRPGATARRGPVEKPHIVGLLCGPVRHRGAAASCD